MQLWLTARVESKLGARTSVSVFTFVLAKLALADDSVVRVAALERGRHVRARKQVCRAGGAHATRLDPVRGGHTQSGCGDGVQRGTAGQGSGTADPAVATRNRKASSGRRQADAEVVRERLGADRAERSDPAQDLALLRCGGPSPQTGRGWLLPTFGGGCSAASPCRGGVRLSFHCIRSFVRSVVCPPAGVEQARERNRGRLIARTAAAPAPA
ncbi:MAG TPA: hypothetical protein VMB51_07390 [Solirubrobacteraceae bacterium]|nr:hypothetical protein [Solirubrobacteraceae bacterium]